MYKIGIIGHTAEYVDEMSSKALVDRTLDLIKFQYGDELVLNIAGDTGVSEWAADTCIEKAIKYHLYLPFPPKENEILLLDEQYNKLRLHFQSAWANSIASPLYDKVTELETRIMNYSRLVDNSRFVICFWNGMKQGTTFEGIKYALSKHILALNAANDLRMIINEDLVKRHDDNTQYRFPTTT